MLGVQLYCITPTAKLSFCDTSSAFPYVLLFADRQQRVPVGDRANVRVDHIERIRVCDNHRSSCAVSSGADRISVKFDQQIALPHSIPLLHMHMKRFPVQADRINADVE